MEKSIQLPGRDVRGRVSVPVKRSFQKSKGTAKKFYMLSTSALEGNSTVYDPIVPGKADLKQDTRKGVRTHSMSWQPNLINEHLQEKSKQRLTQESEINASRAAFAPLRLRPPSGRMTTKTSQSHAQFTLPQLDLTTIKITDHKGISQAPSKDTVSQHHMSSTQGVMSRSQVTFGPVPPAIFYTRMNETPETRNAFIRGGPKLSSHHRFDLLVGFNRSNTKAIQKSQQVTRERLADIAHEDAKLEERMQIAVKLKSMLENRARSRYDDIGSASPASNSSSEDSGKMVKFQQDEVKEAVGPMKNKGVVIEEVRSPGLESMKTGLFGGGSLPGFSPVRRPHFLGRPKTQVVSLVQKNLRAAEDFKREYDRFINFLRNPVKAAKKLRKMCVRRPKILDLLLTADGQRAKEDISEHLIMKKRKGLGFGLDAGSLALEILNYHSTGAKGNVRTFTDEECQYMHAKLFEYNDKSKLKHIERMSQDIINSGKSLAEKCRQSKMKLDFSDFLPKVNTTKPSDLEHDELILNGKTRKYANKLNTALESVYVELQNESFIPTKIGVIRS